MELKEECWNMIHTSTCKHRMAAINEEDFFSDELDIQRMLAKAAFYVLRKHYRGLSDLEKERFALEFRDYLESLALHYGSGPVKEDPVYEEVFLASAVADLDCY